MKRLLLILILIFSFQTLTKAEDISDFEIEGVSIGDNLLNFLTIDEIKNSTYPVMRGSKEFNKYHKVPLNNNSNRYDNVLLYYKKDDPDKIIQAVAGRNYYVENIDECYDLQKTIVKELESIFTESKKNNNGKERVSGFPNGESYKYDVSFYLKDGSVVHTACYDFSIKDTQTRDRLSIGIFSQNYLDWYWSLK